MATVLVKALAVSGSNCLTATPEYSKQIPFSSSKSYYLYVFVVQVFCRLITIQIAIIEHTIRESIPLILLVHLFPNKLSFSVVQPAMQSNAIPNWNRFRRQQARDLAQHKIGHGSHHVGSSRYPTLEIACALTVSSSLLGRQLSLDICLADARLSSIGNLAEPRGQYVYSSLLNGLSHFEDDLSTRFNVSFHFTKIDDLAVNDAQYALARIV